MCSDIRNFYGWVVCQKLPFNSFDCIKTTSKFDGDFMKNHGHESDVGHFLDDIVILNNDMTYHFYQKKWRS